MRRLLAGLMLSFFCALAFGQVTTSCRITGVGVCIGDTMGGASIANGVLFLNSSKQISNDADLTFDGTILTSSALTLTGANLLMTSASNHYAVLSSNGRFAWSSNIAGAQAIDTQVRRGGSAATIALGDADAASPVAQTLTVQSVVAGTSDTAGANFTIDASKGTGTGVPGAIVWRHAPPGSTGSSQNALAETARLAVTADGRWLNLGGGTIPAYANAGTTGVHINAPTGSNPFLEFAVNGTRIGRIAAQASAANFFEIANVGANPIAFYTNISAEQVRITHTASANRYLTLSGSNGGAPVISAAGDGNAGVTIQPPGTGRITLGDGINGVQIRVSANVISQHVNNVLGWTSDLASGTVATGLSQVSSGVVGVGTGAAGSVAGSLYLQDMRAASNGSIYWNSRAVMSSPSDGAVRMANAAGTKHIVMLNGAEPTCDSSGRGYVVLVEGGAGVADTFRVCTKDAADAYGYRALF